MAVIHSVASHVQNVKAILRPNNKFSAQIVTSGPNMIAAMMNVKSASAPSSLIMSLESIVFM